jgi:hypothetical protein
VKESRDGGLFIETVPGGETQRVDAAKLTIGATGTALSMAAATSGLADCRNTRKRASISLTSGVPEARAEIGP